MAKAPLCPGSARPLCPLPPNPSPSVSWWQQREIKALLFRGPCLLLSGLPIQLEFRLDYTPTLILPKTKLFLPHSAVISLSLFAHLSIDFQQADLNTEVFQDLDLRKAALRLSAVYKNQRAPFYVNSKNFQQSRLSCTPLHIVYEKNCLHHLLFKQMVPNI